MMFRKSYNGVKSTTFGLRCALTILIACLMNFSLVSSYVRRFEEKNGEREGIFYWFEKWWNNKKIGLKKIFSGNLEFKKICIEFSRDEVLCFCNMPPSRSERCKLDGSEEIIDEDLPKKVSEYSFFRYNFDIIYDNFDEIIRLHKKVLYKIPKRILILHGNQLKCQELNKDGVSVKNCSYDAKNLQLKSSFVGRASENFERIYFGDESFSPSDFNRDYLQIYSIPVRLFIQWESTIYCFQKSENYFDLEECSYNSLSWEMISKLKPQEIVDFSIIRFLLNFNKDDLLGFFNTKVQEKDVSFKVSTIAPLTILKTTSKNSGCKVDTIKNHPYKDLFVDCGYHGQVTVGNQFCQFTPQSSPCYFVVDDHKKTVSLLHFSRSFNTFSPATDLECSSSGVILLERIQDSEKKPITVNSNCVGDQASKDSCLRKGSDSSMYYIQNGNHKEVTLVPKDKIKCFKKNDKYFKIGEKSEPIVEVEENDLGRKCSNNGFIIFKDTSSLTLSLEEMNFEYDENSDSLTIKSYGDDNEKLFKDDQGRFYSFPDKQPVVSVAAIQVKKLESLGTNLDETYFRLNMETDEVSLTEKGEQEKFKIKIIDGHIFGISYRGDEIRYHKINREFRCYINIAPATPYGSSSYYMIGSSEPVADKSKCTDEKFSEFFVDIESIEKMSHQFYYMMPSAEKVNFFNSDDNLNLGESLNSDNNPISVEFIQSFKPSTLVTVYRYVIRNSKDSKIAYVADIVHNFRFFSITVSLFIILFMVFIIFLLINLFYGPKLNDQQFIHCFNALKAYHDKPLSRYNVLRNSIISKPGQLFEINNLLNKPIIENDLRSKLKEFQSKKNEYSQEFQSIWSSLTNCKPITVESAPRFKIYFSSMSKDFIVMLPVSRVERLLKNLITTKAKIAVVSSFNIDIKCPDLTFKKTHGPINFFTFKHGNSHLCTVINLTSKKSSPLFGNFLLQGLIKLLNAHSYGVVLLDQELNIAGNTIISHALIAAYECEFIYAKSDLADPIMRTLTVAKFLDNQCRFDDIIDVLRLLVKNSSLCLFPQDLKTLCSEHESVNSSSQIWEQISAPRNYQFTYPMPANMNRYKDIIPDDRGILFLKAGFNGINYINATNYASFKGNFSTPKNYIATQGPMPQTTDFFWQMIVETGTRTIVMLTNPVERRGNQMINKCAVYFPTNERSKLITSLNDSKLCIGMILLSERLEPNDKKPVFAVRKINVQTIKQDPQTGKFSVLKEHIVTHFHYMTWPDKDTPDLSEFDLLYQSFNNHQMHQEQEYPNIPVVVHCSAGVGRTGTFIAIDKIVNEVKALESPEDAEKISAVRVINEMRALRPLMVQTESQLKFVYQYLLKKLDIKP